MRPGELACIVDKREMLTISYWTFPISQVESPVCAESCQQTLCMQGLHAQHNISLHD